MPNSSTRFNERRAVTSSDMRGPCGIQRGFDAVCPPRAELHDRTTARGFDDPRRLGCDRYLEIDDSEERGLEKLGLGEWRRDANDGLVRKERRAFCDGPHVAREPEPPQIFEEGGRRATQGRNLLNPADVLFSESQRLDEIECGVETCGNDE